MGRSRLQMVHSFLRQSTRILVVQAWHTVWLHSPTEKISILINTVIPVRQYLYYYSPMETQHHLPPILVDWTFFQYCRAGADRLSFRSEFLFYGSGSSLKSEYGSRSSSGSILNKFFITTAELLKIRLIRKEL